MTSVEIGAGSIANIVSILESIGFQADSQDGQKLYWPYDTDKNIYVYVSTSGSNTIVTLKNSSGTNITNAGQVQFAAVSSWKIVYEIIGESIVFGFLLASTTYNKIQFAISKLQLNQEFANTVELFDYLDIYLPDSGTQRKTVIQKLLCYINYTSSDFGQKIYITDIYKTPILWIDGRSQGNHRKK